MASVCNWFFFIPIAWMFGLKIAKARPLALLFEENH